MSYCRTCLLVFVALPVIAAPAIAQNQNQNKNQSQAQKPAVVQQRPAVVQQRPVVVQQRPAVVQQRPTASRQLNYANQGAAQRNHVFDGTRAPIAPVRVNTAPKPSPVGQPIRSTASSPGYKPAAPSLHINPVPSPTVTRSTTATQQTKKP